MNADQSDLIPVRALNQVSYCPRLYYLEYVEAIMPINEHVEDGLFAHRRVNDPGLASRTRKEGDALRTRSVSISSERLGISGKLDLLEEKGEATRPVEYKRSAAPKDENGEPAFWENDAIQVCAQGLLVEESLGIEVSSGILYYIGSKARVEVPFDESLRAKTLAAIALIRELATREVAPEPLPTELRYRCFGCSLAPICLPEETLYLIHQPESVPDTQPVTPPPLTTTVTRVIAQERRQGRPLPARAGLPCGVPECASGRFIQGARDQPRADRVDPASRGLWQRPGLDPGAAHAGRGRGRCGLPDGLWQIHRRIRAPAREECGACGPPSIGPSRIRSDP